MRKFLFAAILMALTPNHGWAKENGWNLSSIKLLDGYVLKEGIGTDSYVGSIAKKDGLTITFDMGAGAGFVVEPARKENFKWFQAQVINGNTVYLALTKPNDKGVSQLIVTYYATAANFSVGVSDPSEVAEALAMILTYHPPAAK